MDDQQTGQDQDTEQPKRLPIHLDPDQGKQYRFRPGQSGNPAGRPKGKRLLSTAFQEMMKDPKFIDKLNANIKARAGLSDGDFQDTPMKAIITTALIEAMNPNKHPMARGKARDWLRKAGYGDMIDITSEGERISEAPVIISQFAPREDSDAATQSEAS